MLISGKTDRKRVIIMLKNDFAHLAEDNCQNSSINPFTELSKRLDDIDAIGQNGMEWAFEHDYEPVKVPGNQIRLMPEKGVLDIVLREYYGTTLWLAEPCYPLPDLEDDVCLSLGLSTPNPIVIQLWRNYRQQ